MNPAPGTVRTVRLPENVNAYRSFDRNLRWVILGTLTGVLSLLTYTAVVQILPDPSKLTGSHFEAAIFLFSIGGSVSVFCVYAATRMWVPGPTGVQVLPIGLVFEFNGGRKIERAWGARGFRMVMTIVGPVGTEGNMERAIKISILQLAMPRTQLNPTAFGAIMESARTIGLKAEEREVGKVADRYWNQVVLSHPNE
jgi:hypothetical protein